MLKFSIEKTYDELMLLAYTDPLTGLYNRNLLTEIRDGLCRSECLVTIVDMDCLKETNDAQGHQAGDETIRYIAKKLDDISELVFRLGGDEFLLLDFDLNDVGEIRHRLRQIPKISYGSVYKAHNSDFSEAMSRADSAMYLQKRSKKLSR